MTVTRAYYQDRMPGLLPQKKRLARKKQSPDTSVDPAHYDDHVTAWRLVCQAREEGWKAATFFRANCAAYGIDHVKIRSARGGKKVEYVRFVILNRLHGAYPRLSSSQLGIIFGKEHSTVLYHLGKTEKQPSFLKRTNAQ